MSGEVHDRLAGLDPDRLAALAGPRSRYKDEIIPEPAEPTVTSAPIIRGETEAVVAGAGVPKPGSDPVLVLGLRRPLSEVAEGGVRPIDDYVERFWLPTIGPTAFLLGRYLWRHVLPLEPGERTVLPAENTARALGVGHAGNSQLVKAISRLQRFDLIGGMPGSDLVVLTWWPRLRVGNETRLPPALAAEHAALRRAGWCGT